MIEVALEDFEIEFAYLVGGRRQKEALLQGLKHIAGFDGIGWDLHIEGAGGEIAVAKALRQYYGGSVNTFKRGGDVGQLQVRTRSKHIYDLLVRPNDRDDDVFIHVTGTIPNFQVHGWMTGRDAKRPEWLQTYGNRPHAYFVPKAALTPFSTAPTGS